MTRQSLRRPRSRSTTRSLFLLAPFYSIPRDDPEYRLIELIARMTNL